MLSFVVELVITLSELSVGCVELVGGVLGDVPVLEGEVVIGWVDEGDVVGEVGGCDSVVTILDVMEVVFVAVVSVVAVVNVVVPFVAPASCLFITLIRLLVDSTSFSGTAATSIFASLYASTL